MTARLRAQLPQRPLPDSERRERRSGGGALTGNRPESGRGGFGFYLPLPGDELGALPRENRGAGLRPARVGGKREEGRRRAAGLGAAGALFWETMPRRASALPPGLHQRPPGPTPPPPPPFPPGAALVAAGAVPGGASACAGWERSALLRLYPPRGGGQPPRSPRPSPGW